MMSNIFEKVGKKSTGLNQVLKVKRNQVSVRFFYIVSVFSFVLQLLSSYIVPTQFTRDSELYTKRIESAVTGYKDSYQIVVNYYKLLGITENNLVLKILGWLIFFLALTIALRIAKVEFLSISTFAISATYLLLIPFYASVLTKELFIGLFLLIYFLIKNKLPKLNNSLLLVLLSLVYALFLRNYYYITLLIFIFYQITSRIIKLRIVRALSPIIFLSIIATLESKFGVIRDFTGENIFNIRIQIQNRVRIEANSSIDQAISNSSLFHNINNYFQVWVQMVIPYKLVQFSVYSIITLIIVAYISYIFIFPFIMEREAIETGTIFLFAYFIVAMIFEPDLGSYVRHSFPFLALAARNSHHARPIKYNTKN